MNYPRLFTARLFSITPKPYSRLIYRRNVNFPVVLCCSFAEFSSFSSTQTGISKNENTISHNLDKSTTQKKNKLKTRSRRRLILAGALTVILLGLSLTNTQSETKIFDSPRFTPFTIAKREVVSPTCIILTLRPIVGLDNDKLADPYKEPWQQGTWSVQFKQPELQIARAYTPLPPMESNHTHDLRFLIRKERGGEVSGYLHSLPIGAKIELRGPNPEVPLSQEISEVVFLAGGTGIAPALQVAYVLLERRATDANLPKIRILWANRKREDCEGGINLEGKGSQRLDSENRKTGYIVRELDNFQERHPEQVVVEYLVDEEGAFIDQQKITDNLMKVDSRGKYTEANTRAGSRLLFISGPEGFITYVAGPKKWEGGKEEQGEVGGILGRMKLRNWEVWKL